MSYGIDAISVYIPQTFVNIVGDWALDRVANQKDQDVESFRSKLEFGIGIKNISWPDYHEDIVTMGANAVRDLIENHGINLDDVSQLIFASETGVDHSKPASTYVIGLLEKYFNKDLSHIGTCELKYACIGSTYALEAALAFVESRRCRGKYSIVVCSDHARYDLNSNAEYTQGAGAVAMAISANPRLIEIKDVPFGTYVKDERDFYRPLWRKTPVVDGKYSMGVYEAAVLGAFEDYKTSYEFNGPIRDFYKAFDYHLYHIPFPSMAKHTVARFFEEYIIANEQNLDGRDLRKFVTSSEEFKKFYQEKVGKSLELSSRIGNVYTGSMYLGFVSLLRNCYLNHENLSGKEILFNAFGSGASAKVFSGSIAPTWGSVVKNLLKSRYFNEDRRELSLSEYEGIHKFDAYLKNPGNVPQSVFSPKNEFALVKLGFDSFGPTSEGLRIYDFVK